MKALVKILVELDDRIEKLEKEVSEIKENSDGKKFVKTLQQGLNELKDKQDISKAMGKK